MIGLFSWEVWGLIDEVALGEYRQGWRIKSLRGSLPVTGWEEGCEIRRGHGV